MNDKVLATELKEYANKLLSYSSNIEQIDVRLAALSKMDPDALVTVNISTTVTQVPSSMAIGLLVHSRDTENEYRKVLWSRCEAAVHILKGGAM